VQVDITEDQTSPDQLREAFQGAASNKVRPRMFTFPSLTVAPTRMTLHRQPFVTELDLRLAHIPTSAIEYLKEVMPVTPSGAGEVEYDYDAWLDSVFE
jgi:Ca2+ insensitive EF hand